MTFLLKPCTPSNTDNIPPSKNVKAMFKEEVVELLKKDNTKCNIVISNVEEDNENASNVNDKRIVVISSRRPMG